MLALALLASPLEQADALAAAARAAKGERKDGAVEIALAAYAALLKQARKDRRLHPKLRRRRASLLKHHGRLAEALIEHDAILDGRARRVDKARALFDGATILEASGKLDAAERRLKEAVDRYRDATRNRARAARKRGAILERLGRGDEAERSYRLVVEKCRHEEKEAIAAYDALALQSLRRGQPRRARRWLRECFDCYAKRAARGDKKGAFLGRQLAAMKAPLALAEAERPGKGGAPK
ncbi:MAG: hypothetical protein ACYTGZ_19535 [Planctomycetota bacterium]